MIDERGNPVAIDHALAVLQPEQVRIVAVLITNIAFFFRQPWTSVFDNMRAVGDGRSRVTAGSVDRGRTDNQHRTQFTGHSLQLRMARDEASATVTLDSEKNCKL